MSEVNTLSDWKNAARNAESAGCLSEAAAAWREVLWLRPDDAEAMHGLAACGEVKAAIEAMQASLRRNPDQSRLWGALATLWIELAEWDKAEQALEHVEDGSDLRQQLENARSNPGRAYARHLFNDYAPRFESALAALGYKAPQLIAEALGPYLKPNQRITDLGCGTGLMAPYLRPHAAHLTGVDIAQKMLDEARKRDAYDELVCADMVAALQGSWDIIVAADAVVYVGDLAPLMQAAAKVLTPEGVMALSFEVNGVASGYTLQESKRFAHSLAYVTETAGASGLTVVSLTPAVLRQDRGQPIAGAIALLAKSTTF